MKVALGSSIVAILVGLSPMETDAANSPRYRLRKLPPPVDSRADLTNRRSDFGREVRISSAASILTPGHQYGTTYYDHQQVGSTGRQIDEDNGKIQFTWMKGPGPTTSIRSIPWNRTNVASPPMDFTLANGETIRYLRLADQLLGVGETFYGVRAGYTNLRNRPGGKAVAIYHDAPLSGGVQFWETRLDLSAGNGVFAGSPSVAPSPSGSQYIQHAPIWPKQAISTCGADLIHHAIGIWSGDSSEVWYWRGVINDGAGSISWNASQPTLIDPRDSYVTAVIEAHGDTVVIAMVKNVNAVNADLVYYQSIDCGMTWGPMVNVTHSTKQDPEGLWIEIGAVFDDDGELHLIYNTTPANGSKTPANLYHWSPSTGARLITSAPWQLGCGPSIILPAGLERGAGASNLALSDPNLSVKPAGLHGIAEELVIAVWTQFGPTDSDFASPNYLGDPCGYTNGEIYMSVSSDNGLTWDRPQNLTGTETPGCLPGDCASEGWVSAAARADSSVYLSYVEDRHAGAVVLGEGAWAEAPYMVLAPETRLPVSEPVIAVVPAQFVELQADPVSGTPENVSLTIHNTGTAALSFSATVTPDGGGLSYVAVNGAATYAGSISAGGPPDVIQIQFNTAGLPDPSEHRWRLEVTSNDPENDPGQGGAPIEVDLQVFAASVWFTCDSDTLSTLTHRMQISSCLELSAQGSPGLGFFDIAAGTEWLVSGSPVICRVSPSGDTLAYHNAYLTPADRTRTVNTSFRAQSAMNIARDTLIATGFPGSNHIIPVDLAWGSACTTDSTIGLEYRMVFPRVDFLSDGAYLTLAMHNRTGAPITGLTFGALADFDVTSAGNSDPAVNQGIASYAAGYVGVRGGSANDSGNFIPTSNCMGLFRLNPDGACYHVDGEGAGQIIDNGFYLQPGGSYAPDSLFTLFNQFGSLGGWSPTPHVDTGQAYGDLSAMVVYDYQASLGPGDTLRWGFGIVESKVSEDDLAQKLRDLRQSAGSDSTDCCPIEKPGDVNVSHSVTSADAIFLVNYVFKSGLAPSPCHANGDVNCDGVVTSADIIYLVNYIFKLGVPPCDICHDSPLSCVG
jgi:hypothetical protein